MFSLPALTLLVGSHLAHASLIPSHLLFVLPSSSPATVLADPPSCSSLVYHGTYENSPVHRIHRDRCTGDEVEDWVAQLDSTQVDAEQPGHAPYALIHAQPARTEGPDLGTQDWLRMVQGHIEDALSGMLVEDQHGEMAYQQQQQQQQQVFQSSKPPKSEDATSWSYPIMSVERPLSRWTQDGKPVIYSTSSAFYAVPKSLLPVVDMIFPPSIVLVAVSETPLEETYTSQGDSKDVPQWLTEALRKVHYSPLIDAVIQDIDTEVLQRDVRHLTAEDGHDDWRTRHSFTAGGRAAGHWIKETMKKEAGVDCELQEHNYGFSPNVICTFRGTELPDELVVMGAHYDNRGTFGNVRAPGGDDDASGTSALLSLARIFKAYNVQFSRTVVLAFFSGEEQGLLGSKAYAKSLKEGGKNVRMMLQADMLGYRNPGEPMQIALPDRYDTIEARWLVGNLSLTYVPQLQVGTTPACCSDHQSFDEQGFVSTWVFERNGPIADPKYHNSEDLSDRPGYDFEQIAAIARVMLATVLEVAGFTL